jgi:hypothetical protein
MAHAMPIQGFDDETISMTTGPSLRGNKSLK